MWSRWISLSYRERKIACIAPLGVAASIRAMRWSSHVFLTIVNGWIISGGRHPPPRDKRFEIADIYKRMLRSVNSWAKNRLTPYPHLRKSRPTFTGHLRRVSAYVQTQFLNSWKMLFVTVSNCSYLVIISTPLPYTLRYPLQSCDQSNPFHHCTSRF